MGGTFNPQILVEKLGKLNSSQQSIETLSHWCIFHMSKAKQVVETWGRQFRCSPRDQRVSFLYLANDILQNSRRKGSEFVGEFWKVLPGALRDVINNMGESEKNAALRLVKIWDERKVFGSRGPILKEKVVGRHLEISNRNEKRSRVKKQQSARNALDKIVSESQSIYGGQFDEDATIIKCKDTICCIEKVGKEIGGDSRSGMFLQTVLLHIGSQENGPDSIQELKGHNATLRDCIEQLSAVEASRTNLVCYIQEVLQEQEMKLDQVRNELQAAHSQSKKADNICKQLLKTGGTEQSAPVTYTQQVPVSNKSDENSKSAAEAVAAKLTASKSSAEMLSNVLSSLASESNTTGNSVKESSSSNYPPEKRAKIHNFQNRQPSMPPESSCDQPPPPPSSPPPLPPMPPMQAYPVSPFMETPGTMPYRDTTNQQPPPPPSLPGYAALSINGGGSYTQAPPPTAYRSYQMEGVFSSQPMAPMSRP
ncbi:hypothetical protein SSX86_016100 [Deinandra increscens subsp. villosa]|uniref:CID domain-containing protein n=1 Tax=Deinandra increscens subsp. villosa TaxID=3103831 RepID=A0AAP0D4U2_9ASTR